MYHQIECIHDVDDSKVEAMCTKVWCDYERPIVAVPLEFTLSDRDSSTNGYLLFTRGAAYLFKAKFLTNQPDFVHKFHMLHVKALTIRKQSLIFEFDTTRITLKTDDSIAIATAMLTVLYESTYGVPNIQLPAIRKEAVFPDVIVNERPKNALKWRALFLAHYYDIKGEQLYTLDYFDKWEDKQKPIIILGPSLHPGNFASAYGHAVAWETKLDSVAFQSFAPTKYSSMIESLLLNACTITRIAYTDYKPKKLPIFNMHVPKTSVKLWWFLRCCADLILLWAEESRNLPVGLTDIVIGSCQLTPNDFSQFVNLVQRSPAASKMTTFDFSRIVLPNFPFQDLTRLCTITTNLETLFMRGIDVDGTRLFRAICKAQSPVKSIHLTHLQYRSAFKLDDTRLPPTLLQIDVSNSAFTSSALNSLLVFLTAYPQQIPFVFQAASLAIKSEYYQAMSEIKFDQCQPNICEFDWSYNTCPADTTRFLFAFIFTQNRLRLLSMNGIQTDNATTFMQYIIQLSQPLNLAGLNIASCSFEPQLFAQFLQALANVKSLRHLDVSNSKSGDQGLAALDLVVKSIPNLNELVADGFRPTNPAAICAVWNDISLCPDLKAVDLPVEDMRNIGMQPHRLDQQTQKAFATLKAKSRPSTFDHRVYVTIKDMKEGRQAAFSPEIFSRAASVAFKVKIQETFEAEPQPVGMDE